MKPAEGMKEADPGGHRLEQHRGEFQTLLARAAALLARDRVDAAAAYAEAAAQLAWMNHTGIYASADLEALVADLGWRLAPVPFGRAPIDDPRTVLHVVTQAYPTGGSTRQVVCWLEQDAGRRHHVCITRQGPTPPPEALSSRVRSPSGLIRLDTGRGGLMSRAALLRKIGAEFDVVVLHTHPYDVVPAIAFAGTDGPPVVYVNHADHVFWLGTGITNLLMNMRESGRQLAVSRRGIAPERGFVAPRPLLPPHRTMTRAEAKRRLGLDPDTMLMTTAADATKYRPVDGPGFLDLVVPSLMRHPAAVLVAAGPSPQEAWAEAARVTGGRVRAIGRVPDVTLLHQASDIYLDSFPFSSLTSLLEAGSYGTPALTYRGHPDGCGVLGADTPGIDAHLLAPRDPEGLDQALTRLIVDSEGRRQLGARMEQAIRSTHTGPGWRDAAAEMYRRAARLGRPGPAEPAAPQAATLDLLVDGVMVQTGCSQGLRGALRDHLGLLPPGARAAAATRLILTGELPPARNLLPEWTLPHLAATRRLALRIGADGRRRLRAAPAPVAGA